jgi:hypothetical protein
MSISTFFIIFLHILHTYSKNYDYLTIVVKAKELLIIIQEINMLRLNIYRKSYSFRAKWLDIEHIEYLNRIFNLVLFLRPLCPILWGMHDASYTTICSHHVIL